MNFLAIAADQGYMAHIGPPVRRSNGACEMSNSLRKLIGTVAIILFVIAYALVVMALAQPVLKDAGVVTQLLFYALAGLAWILPVMPLIAWMERK